MAFGQPVETRYDFSKADVVVSLDADFLYAGWPGNVRYIRDFALRRDPDIGQMNRLYAIESTPSATGAKADHRLPVQRRVDIERVVLDPAGSDCVRLRAWRRVKAKERRTQFVGCAQGLQRHQRFQRRHRGRSSAASRACSRTCDQCRLGNVGKTVVLHRTSRRESRQPDRIAQRSRQRHESRQSRSTDHPRRQSGLRCAR